MTQLNSAATIAIVGGGFSGTMVATHLLRTATRPLTVSLLVQRRLSGSI
jgi:uncharacterized NAD(P)/FAD-binding protein YdhS